MAQVTSVTDGIVTTLGAVLARRRIRLEGSLVKVNLGSGLDVAPGWVNLDASLNALASHAPEPVQRAAYSLSGARRQRPLADYLNVLQSNRFVFCDLRRGIPLADCVVDHAYASHILEHLEREEAQGLLMDLLRVLKPGGVVRIVVPSLRHYVDVYLAGDAEGAAEGLFAADVPGRLGRHRFMYDEDSLGRLLSLAGFRDIVQCAYRQGVTPDLERLDNRPDESLYMEARR